jgi:hypothetical protein
MVGSTCTSAVECLASPIPLWKAFSLKVRPLIAFQTAPAASQTARFDAGDEAVRQFIFMHKKTRGERATDPLFDG